MPTPLDRGNSNIQNISRWDFRAVILDHSHFLAHSQSMSFKGCFFEKQFINWDGFGYLLTLAAQLAAAIIVMSCGEISFDPKKVDQFW